MINLGIIQQKPLFPTTGLVLYCPLNEGSGSTTDNVVSSFDGTLNSTAIWSADGKNMGGVRTIDGVNTNYITFNSRFISVVPVTISFWLRTGSGFLSSRVHGLFQIGRPPLARWYGFLAYYFNGIIQLQCGNGNTETATGRRSYDFNPTLNDGNWHHVVAQIMAFNNQKLFVDGEELTPIATSGTATTINWGNDSIALLSYHTLTQNNADIYHDEFAIWNVQLTPQQIKDIYNLGMGTYYANV
jgi:hypothetical protein